MRKKWLLAIPIVLIVIYLLGPSPASPGFDPAMPAVPATEQLETFVQTTEAAHKLKKDNEARIIWANDSVKSRTPYAFVYLHGFSASQAEGEPTHRNLAKKFGANLYLSRLSEHGTDTVDPMIRMTADGYWESAKQALAIGNQLGEKVVLLATSSGGTLALQLAAKQPSRIHAMVLMSPNIEINNDKAYLLNNHWGLQLARWVNGSGYVTSKDTRSIYKQYWHYQYPLEAAVQLQEILESSMKPELFQKVKQPVLMMYYYKDSVHQDSVVRVDAMLKMFDELGTPSNLKKKVPLPGTGDHVIGSYIKSRDIEAVEREATAFLVSIGIPLAQKEEAAR